MNLFGLDKRREEKRNKIRNKNIILSLYTTFNMSHINHSKERKRIDTIHYKKKSTIIANLFD